MNSKLPILVFALVALAAFGQQKPAYSDADAGKHVGEEATVTGKVFNVSTSGKGTTFLNFGDRYPRHTFGGVIFASNREAVGDVKQFEGKEVSLTGRIETSPDQKPQIIIKSPDQIKLVGPANPLAPTPVAAKPMVTPPAPPAPVPPATPASEPPSKNPAGKIELPLGWNSPRRGGEMTRKDLARLFGEVGSASETDRVDTSIEVYPGVTLLASLATAKRTLNLEGAQFSKTKVSTPGFPQQSFNAHEASGVFPGGFNRICLVTDVDDQVLSVLLVDSSSRTRVDNEPDTTGYHTYNFVTGAGKAANYLVIRHTINPSGKSPGVVVVDSMLVDPTDPENQSSGRFKSSSSRSSSSSKPRTGKVLERSRWFVPAPVVNLILRCVGG